MADTTNFGWTKPTVGGNVGSWGTVLNAAFDDIDTDLDTVKDTADAALARAGGTLTGEVVAETIVYGATNLGASLSGTVDIDMALGDAFYGTTAGSVTFTFSNIPTTGKMAFKTVEITVASSSHTITWPASVRWPSAGSAPSSFTTGRVQVFVMYTRDGGTKWRAQWVPEFTA